MGTTLGSRVLAVGAVIGLVFAVACGSQTPAATTAPTTAASAAPSAAATSAAPVAQRGAGGDLKLLYWQAPTILNPHQATGTKDNDASRLVIEPLAGFDNNGKAVPVLAAEAPTTSNGGVSSDFKTVTWKLKSGLKWSDGSPFTADDVAFTYTYMCDPKTAASTSDRCEGVASVVAKDPTTVVVTYKESNPFFYQWGAGLEAGIIQKAQYANCVGDKAKNCPADLKPIGTGPYMVSDFKPGDVVTYALNPNYRDANKPFFKTVTLKGGGDANASAQAACRTGDVDYAWNLQVEATILKPMTSASDAKCSLTQNYGPAVERIVVQFANPDPSLGDQRAEPGTKHPFLTDINVRKALAMSANRAAVAEQLYGGGLTGKATCNIVTAPEPDNSKNTASLDVCKYDVAAATKLLDDNGWKPGPDGVRAKGGVRLEISYNTTVNAVRQKTQDILKADWEKVGFKVNLKSQPASTFFTNTSPDGANHFFGDLEMYTNSGDPDNTSYLFSGWACSEASAKANNWNKGNYGRYCNQDFDNVIKQLRTETDPAKRDALFVQANDILVKDVAIIPLIVRVAPTADGYSKTLKGINVSVWDSVLWNIADWSK